MAKDLQPTFDPLVPWTMSKTRRSKKCALAHRGSYRTSEHSTSVNTYKEKYSYTNLSNV